MGLSHPEQELKLSLRGLASELEWSAVELVRIAERLSLAGNEADAETVLRTCAAFHAGGNRLIAYAGEVSEGQIIRLKAG